MEQPLSKRIAMHYIAYQQPWMTTPFFETQSTPVLEMICDHHVFASTPEGKSSQTRLLLRIVVVIAIDVIATIGCACVASYDVAVMRRRKL